MSIFKLQKSDIPYLETTLRKHNIEFSDAELVDGGRWQISIDQEDWDILAELFIVTGMRIMRDTWEKVKQQHETTAKENSNKVVVDVIADLTKE